MKHALPLFAAGLSTALLTTPSLTCHEISIPINISTQSKDIPLDLDLNLLKDIGKLENLVKGLGSSLINDSFNISARYCEPTNTVASRRDTLQVLVHGITYTRNYWSGLAAPGTKAGQDEYSWIKYAAEQGYPTLSIDRLCNGESSRPNGLLLCQLPVEVEAVRAIVDAARSGNLPKADRGFSKIIYVGHSYGSLVGNGLSVQHADIVDAYVLTGYSAQLTQGEPGVLVLPLFLPATISPHQFSNLQQDLFYLQATSREGARTVFYHGDYSEEIFQHDFTNRGTVTVGEVVTAQLGQIPAHDFKGAVFVLNGNEDGIFCEDGPVQALAGVPGNCSDEYSSNVRAYYPGASKFGFYNTANTGHCLNTHRTAQLSFKRAHDFLADAGF